MRGAYELSEHDGGTHFVQGPASNWVVLRAGDRFTLIDGGYPADTASVLDSIRALGLEPAAAAAMLLTHGHVDHTGAANHFATTYGTTVLCAAAEYGQVLGRERFQVGPREILLRAWRPAVFRWAVHVLRAGGATPTAVPSVGAWDAAALAALPGSPVPVPTPGHTPGHTAFHLPLASVLVSGDALVSGHAISHLAGPQMLHPMFHHDVPGAYRALAAFSALTATTVLPGHGPALHEDAATAARLAGGQHRPWRG